MPITPHDKREIEQLFSDYKGTYGGVKEDYFACLYLAKKFGKSVPDIANQVAFGNNDYGIDAFFIDREARNLYLFQFKWSENHGLLKESLQRLAKDGIERIFGDAPADPKKNQLLANLRAELSDSRDLIKRVLIHMVFKGDQDAAENSEGLQQRREDVENKRYLIDKYFGSTDVEFRVEFVTDVRRPNAPPPPQSFDLRLAEAASIKTEDGPEMHVGFVPLEDLHGMYVALGQRLLDRNIRSGLNEQNTPNRKIREALTDILNRKVEPEVFAFNHNGITLAVEDFHLKDGICKVKVPRLLNGAQTITSVARFMEDHEKHPSLKAADSPMRKIRVLAKIVVDDPSSDFIANVTICNNRQNPVDPWNLRAMDRIQCDLHDHLRDSVQIFYSRQENAFSNYSEDELEKAGYDSSSDMRIRPLAQTFLAIQGEIPKMSQLPDVFENQKSYEETFRDTYLSADARKIVIAYKVGVCLRSPMDRLEERASGKHRAAVARARNLVWALLVQALLNHKKLPDLLDSFGTSLTKEATFRSELAELASSRVLPILRRILEDKAYQPKLLEEKYDFLRTKEVFKRSMDIGNELFDWSRKSI